MNKLEIICDILKCHVGKSNEITSAQIADIIGLQENATHAITRALILEAAKKYNLPLAANRFGYFLISNKSEHDEYIKNLNLRIAGIEERKKIVINNSIEQQIT